MHDSRKSPYVVFQRPDSPNYWARFSIPGQGQKRIGLKTPDIIEATRRAEREYNRAVWSAEEGILPGKTSFDKVARQIPRIELVVEQRNKRPSFTDAEIEELFAVAEIRIMEAFGHRQRRNAKLPSAMWTDPTAFESRVRYERMVLYCFINIALETGMRSTELFNLDWGHIVGFREEREKPIALQRIRILAYGKGRKPQQLMPNVEAFQSFCNLWDAFVTMHGREPGMADAVFVNAAGERAQSFKKSLNALLDATGLKEDVFGRPRSAYSFRHTYATRQLRKGTDIYTLAVNMRTSVKMIEMYYSDVMPDDFARQLDGSYE